VAAKERNIASAAINYHMCRNGKFLINKKVTLYVTKRFHFSFSLSLKCLMDAQLAYDVLKAGWVRKAKSVRKKILN
jgi:hypothetical protein